MIAVGQLERVPAAAAQALAAEALRGLLATPKTLPSKYLYDSRGSALFELITLLPEYYLTRAELSILVRHGREIARRLGPRCLLIEPGSGSGRKARHLLWRLEDPVAYVPVDISPGPLHQSAAWLREQFPGLEVLPVCADVTAPFAIPRPRRRPERALVYYPGSTLGNFHPPAAAAFLRRLAAAAGVLGAPVALLVGIDLKKDPAVLNRAYNDRAGVTAAFNLNLLARLNHELDADFVAESFAHEAVYNPVHGRIEMFLRSRIDQSVRVGDDVVHFDAGEKILTEVSYKYDEDGFRRLAGWAGLRIDASWQDRGGRFAVHLLAPCSE